MTATLPQYLAEPTPNGQYRYGRLEYLPGLRKYRIEAEPRVLQVAKRLFPGSNGRGNWVEFDATARSVGDLNWMLLRYPMTIDCAEQFERDRESAIRHAERRENNQRCDAVEKPAGFVGELKPFQQEGVGFLAANQRTLLADDMGLGKTVEALAALGHVGGFPAVIVTPPSVQKQWSRQDEQRVGMIETFLSIRDGAEMFDGPPKVHRIRGLKSYPLPPASIYMIHYGLLRAWGKTLVEEVRPRAVVFDEIQELRHTGTQKYSKASLLAGEATWVWGLSGTPIYNYGDEMWSVMNIIEMHCLGDRDSFTREWCSGYQSKIVEHPDVLGNYLVREGLMLRRRKADVQDQLPPKRRVVMPIDHDQDQFARLARRAVELARGYDGIKGWHERGQAAREIDRETRQACGISKAAFAVDFIGTLVEAGERPLVFAYHHAVHEILSERLASARPVRITGLETAREKDLAVETFAAGGANLAIVSLRTAAGLDGLQGRATCVVFVELDWSPAIHSQCEDRLQRIGVDESLDSILCYYLVAATGIDEVMQDALGIKIGQFCGLVGDSPQSEEDKRLGEQKATDAMERLIERMVGKVNV